MGKRVSRAVRLGIKGVRWVRDIAVGLYVVGYLFIMVLVFMWVCDGRGCSE
jgi:hypothetical protein